MNWGELEAVFETVARRRELLALLADEPLGKASIVRRLDVSRSTVNRAVSELQSHGFVERVDGTYATTTAGEVALRHLRGTLSTVEGLVAARALLPCAEGLDLPPALFRDATVVTADENRHGPVRVLVDLLVEADRVRSLGAVFRTDVPTTIRDRLAADGTLRMELLASPETVDRMRAYHEPELRTLVGSDRHELRVGDAHCRTTVAIVEAGGEETVVLVFYDERDEPIGLVRTTDPAGLAWARERIERSWTEANPAEEAIEGQ
jgi:predicted transcriptional regulator